MAEFERALTEATENLRRGPPLPQRRQPPREQAQPKRNAGLVNRPAGELTPEQQASDQASVTPTESVRGNLQTVEDVARVVGNEVLMDTLPFLQAAVASALSGGEVDFDEVRRQFQQSVESAKQRLGETGTAAAELGGLAVPGGIGARLAGKGREIVGGITGASLGEFVRGAAEPQEPDTLDASRLVSGAERVPVGAVTGGATGAVLKGGRIAGERVGEAIQSRRKSSNRKTNAEIRRRGQELTKRPDDDRADTLLQTRPNDVAADVFRGIDGNLTIPQIASQLNLSQDDVARVILRNRNKVGGATPGDKRFRRVDLADQSGTVDARNFDRITKEARDITKTVDRFRALPASRSRPARATRSQQTPAQAGSSRQAAAADPIEQGRQQAISGQSQAIAEGARRQTRRSSPRQSDVEPLPDDEIDFDRLARRIQGETSREALPSAQQNASALRGGQRSQGQRSLEDDVSLDETARQERIATGQSLPASTRARQGVRAASLKPARRKFENTAIINRAIVNRELTNDQERAVAEALGLDTTRGRLRERIISAANQLNAESVSALAAIILGATAGNEGDDS